MSESRCDVCSSPAIFWDGFDWCDKCWSSNPKNRKKTLSEGLKHDTGKPPMELLSHLALVEITKVFEFGAKKYARYNYRNGIAYSRIIGAAYRHLGAFNSGEDIDPETGLSHMAHLAACSIMLLDTLRDHPSLDDRFKLPKKNSS